MSAGRIGRDATFAAAPGARIDHADQGAAGAAARTQAPGQVRHGSGIVYAAPLPSAPIAVTVAATQARGARLLPTLALLVLCALQWFALLRAPAAWMPSDVTLMLARGTARVLRHADLGAPASAAALTLQHDAAGAWWATSTDPGQPLQLQDGDHKRRGASVVPAAGQRFQLGRLRFTVDAADGGSATFSAGGIHWRYDGALLRRDGQAQPSCPDAHLGTRVAAFWNRLAPRALSFARPLVFGGNVDCGNRIAIAGLPAPAASIVRGTDGLVLLAASGSDAAPLLLADGGQEALLAGRPLRLSAGALLSAGRTRLRVEPDGDRLHLVPLSHVALYADAQRRLPDGVAWTWTRCAPWQLPPSAATPLLAVAALALAAALAAGLAGGKRRAAQPGKRLRSALLAGAGTLLAGAGITLFWLQRSGAPVGAGIALVAAWCALWCAMLAPRRLDLALAAALLLLGIGLLAQLDLGLGAPESSWLRHFHKTAALLAFGTGACMLLACVRPARPLAQAHIEAGLLALTGVALAALLLQVAYGDETGVFDLQPVEFAKLALTALTAHCLALAGNGRAGPGPAWRRALRLAAPVLLFMLLLAVALVQVDDYSPLVLLALWSGAMALAQALASGRRGVAVLLVLAALGAVGAVALLRGAGADGIARWDFYADRFLVWLDPATHPHTGQQLLLGAHAIAQGGWCGADGLFGLGDIGHDPGFALRIPAVQDDFAASFFLQRHGLVAALGLWLLQALFLAGLARLAVRCWLHSLVARDFRLAWLARLRCFLLAGGAAFAFGHFLLSWGTNLAIFPVMGQPMSFLSAGGSHLLFFICPLLGVAAASRQSLEENEHAGLRPT